MDFLARYAPQKIIRGAYIINIFFFATCGTKIRRIFYPPKSVIVLRHFGVDFLARYAPQKIIRGAYIINIFFFATCGTKIRRIFYPPKSVIVLRHFGVDFFLGEIQIISQQVGIAYYFSLFISLR